MNREQRRAAKFKHGQRWDRNAVADPLAVLRPISICTPFTSDEAASLSVETRAAWHRLTNGAGSEPDFDLVGNSCNVALVQAERIDELVVDVVLRAQDALNGIKARYLRTGRWGADATALADVPPMLELYDQMLALGTPAVMVADLNETARRIRLQQREGVA